MSTHDRIDVDAILATLPELDDDTNPWGSSNLPMPHDCEQHGQFDRSLCECGAPFDYCAICGRDVTVHNEGCAA